VGRFPFSEHHFKAPISLTHPLPASVQTGDMGNTRSETWVTLLSLASFVFCVERFDEVMSIVDVVCALDLGWAKSDVFALECVW
jgi:hypothetical protein